MKMIQTLNTILSLTREQTWFRLLAMQEDAKTKQESGFTIKNTTQ